MRRPSSRSLPDLRQAAVKTLEQELWVVLEGAHKVAAGYGLRWSDYERLHDAYQHVLRVLAEVNGKEVQK